MKPNWKKKPSDIVFGIDVAAPGSPDLTVVAMAGEAKTDPEDPDVIYFETHDGLRLIFRNGKYAGFYTPLLAEVMDSGRIPEVNEGKISSWFRKRFCEVN